MNSSAGTYEGKSLKDGEMRLTREILDQTKASCDGDCSKCINASICDVRDNCRGHCEDENCSGCEECSKCGNKGCKAKIHREMKLKS